MVGRNAYHSWNALVSMGRNTMSDEIRLYAVSSGNGNDGVSHTFPDYYVLTNDPYRLAALAMVSSFAPKFKQAAADVCEVDGESDYTVYATIYNPEDVDPSEASGNGKECDCGANDNDEDEHSDECALFVDNDDDSMSYCNVNGAWQVIEVFPEDTPKNDRPMYDSLEDCFDDDELKLVPAES